MAAGSAEVGTQERDAAVNALPTQQQDVDNYGTVSQNLVTALTTARNLLKYLAPEYPKEGTSIRKLYLPDLYSWSSPNLEDSSSPEKPTDPEKQALLALLLPDSKFTTVPFRNVSLWDAYTWYTHFDLEQMVGANPDGSPNFNIKFNNLRGALTAGDWFDGDDAIPYLETLIERLEATRIHFVDDLNFEKYNAKFEETLTHINIVRSFAVTNRIYVESIKSFTENSGNQSGQKLQGRLVSAVGFDPYKDTLPQPFRLNELIIQIKRIITDLDKIKNLIDAKGKQLVHKDLLVNVLLDSQGFERSASDPDVYVQKTIEKDPWGIRFTVQNSKRFDGAELIRTTNERLERVQNAPRNADNEASQGQDGGDAQKRQLEAIDEDILDGKTLAGTDSFFMHLLPAMKSNLPIQGGTDVPGVLPGLNFSIKHNIVKHKVPGFQPIYQPLGVDCIKCTLVGTFTGADGVDLWSESEQDNYRKEKGSTTMPLEFTGRSDPFEGFSALLKTGKTTGRSDIVGITKAYDAFRNAQNFYNMIIAPGKEVEVEINLKKVDVVLEGGSDGPFRNSTTGNPQFKALVKSMDLYYARADRCWYIMELEITDAGLISNECLNLTKDLSGAIDALDEAARERARQIANKTEIRRCIDEVCALNPTTCRTYENPDGTKMWKVDLFTGYSYLGNIANDFTDDVYDIPQTAEILAEADNGNTTIDSFGWLFNIFQKYNTVSDLATMLLNTYIMPEPNSGIDGENVVPDEASLVRPGFSIKQILSKTSGKLAIPIPFTDGLTISISDPEKFTWDRDGTRFIELKTAWFSNITWGKAQPHIKGGKVSQVDARTMLKTLQDDRQTDSWVGLSAPKKAASKNLLEVQRTLEALKKRRDPDGVTNICDVDSIEKRLGRINKDGVRIDDEDGDNNWGVDGPTPRLFKDPDGCYEGTLVETLGILRASSAAAGLVAGVGTLGSASGGIVTTINAAGTQALNLSPSVIASIKATAPAGAKATLTFFGGAVKGLVVAKALAAGGFVLIGVGVASGIYIAWELLESAECAASIAAVLNALDSVASKDNPTLTRAVQAILFKSSREDGNDRISASLRTKLNAINIIPQGFTASDVSVDSSAINLANGIEQSSNYAIKLTVDVNINGGPKNVTIGSNNYQFGSTVKAELYIGIRGGYQSIRATDTAAERLEQSGGSLSGLVLFEELERQGLVETEASPAAVARRAEQEIVVTAFNFLNIGNPEALAPVTPRTGGGNSPDPTADPTLTNAVAQ